MAENAVSHLVGEIQSLKLFDNAKALTEVGEFLAIAFLQNPFTGMSEWSVEAKYKFAVTSSASLLL